MQDSRLDALEAVKQDNRQTTHLWKQLNETQMRVQTNANKTRARSYMHLKVRAQTIANKEIARTYMHLKLRAHAVSYKHRDAGQMAQNTFGRSTPKTPNRPNAIGKNKRKRMSKWGQSCFLHTVF